MPLKFTTAGKTYTAAALTRPSIRDFLNLAKQSEAIGRKLTSGDVFRIEQEINACGSATERTEHPDFLMFLALVVWATLIEAGEPDPFERAIDTSLDDLEFFYVDEPAAAVDPSKARTPAASARAGNHHEAGALPAGKKTSKRRSLVAS